MMENFSLKLHINSLSKENQKECIITFFIQIDDWINNDVNKNDYFWILGI